MALLDTEERRLYNRKYRQRLVASGHCSGCATGIPALGKKCCSDCITSARERRIRYAASGACTYCGCRTAKAGRRGCSRCLVIKQQSSRRLHSRFVHGAYIAKRRGLHWELSKAEYEAISNGPCFYCGSTLPEVGAGLDRLDNSRGYDRDNVVPCCGVCNTIRSDRFSAGEMRLIGAVICQIYATRGEQVKSFEQQLAKRTQPKLAEICA